MQPASGEYTRWIGRTETVHDALAATQALAAAATLGVPEHLAALGMPLPPLWHWFYFLPRAPQASLAADGHPPRGHFLPPLPLPRRMFAGARLTFHHPLVIGEPAERIATVRDVTLTRGRSGDLGFVRVAYEVRQRNRTCVTEEQTLVYRERDAPAPAPARHARAATAGRADHPVAAVDPARPRASGTVERVVHPDTRLLFRFSALTFNAHRIHYDRDYARDEEGYPGLVMHGPLIAMQLLALARECVAAPPAGPPLTHFDFRSERPLFDLAPYRLVASRTNDDVALEAVGPDGLTAQRAQARFGASPDVADAAGGTDVAR